MAPEEGRGQDLHLTHSPTRAAKLLSRFQWNLLMRAEPPGVLCLPFWSKDLKLKPPPGPGGAGTSGDQRVGGPLTAPSCLGKPPPPLDLYGALRGVSALPAALAGGSQRGSAKGEIAGAGLVCKERLLSACCMQA